MLSRTEDTMLPEKNGETEALSHFKRPTDTNRRSWRWLLLAGAGICLYFGNGSFLMGDASPRRSTAAGTSLSKNITDKTPARSIEPSLLSLVTAFSSNHHLEAVLMLRSLIEKNYTGPIDIYLMRRPGEALLDEIRYGLKQELEKSPLNAKVIEYEVAEAYSTYCFKPKVIQDFWVHATISNTKPKILMWADASTRYQANPEVWASSMLQDGIDFVGRTGVMGMGENTHEDTYKYFNKSRTAFKDYKEIAGGHFLVNLMRDGVESAVLEPLFHCASSACQTCMAPIGSQKHERGAPKMVGPPSMKYVGHRQDQSVLGLLVYDFQLNQGGNVRLDNKTYMFVHTKRNERAKAVSDLNWNLA